MKKVYYVCDVCGKKISFAQIHGQVQLDVIGAKTASKYDLCENCVGKITSIFKNEEGQDGA